MQIIQNTSIVLVKSKDLTLFFLAFRVKKLETESSYRYHLPLDRPLYSQSTFLSTLYYTAESKKRFLSI